MQKSTRVLRLICSHGRALGGAWYNVLQTEAPIHLSEGQSLSWRLYATRPTYRTPIHAEAPGSKDRNTTDLQNSQKHVIYKGKWIIPARFLVRGKIFQLMGVLGLTSMVAGMMLEEATTLDILALGSIAVGVAVSSNSMWYYSRRYVGEMSLLLPAKTYVRFSTLDFWGNREDNDVPIASIEPPFKGVREGVVKRLTSQLLFPVTVKGDRQYYLSLPAGLIYDEEVFWRILYGKPLA